MLSERLLQFIWQFQYFNTKELVTTDDEALQIVHPGVLNTNQGPDFTGAKIKIGNTLLAGNVEIHLKAGDWFVHQHDTDDNYRNVILHVVWTDDALAINSNGFAVPTLLLQPLVSKTLLLKYENLMQSPGFVPCALNLPALSLIGWQNWQERVLVERLEKRSAFIFQKLAETGNHWEETFWRLLARNFGMPVNADAFENMANSIPLKVLAKHKHQVQQIEALMLGQCGLLNDEFGDAYPLLLQREYRFLQNKYQLSAPAIQPVFLRMRPANFPTIRLAQLAVLICQSEHLFSKILEAKEYGEIKQLLQVTANDFWHYHYTLHSQTDYKPKVLGHQMVDNILINTVVPLVFAYGLYHSIQPYKEKALEWLALTAAEDNNVIKQWRKHGVPCHNALQSQGLLELKKHYCEERKCLDCAAGNKLIKQAT